MVKYVCCYVPDGEQRFNSCTKAVAKKGNRSKLNHIIFKHRYVT